MIIRMVILIESPKSLLVSLVTVHGANKISAILLQLFLQNVSKQVIVVSDLNSQECVFYNKQVTGNDIVYTNYLDLAQLIVQNNSVPDVAISFDIKINTLLNFRQTQQYHFPVIGLIHSLGFESHLRELLLVSQSMRPYDALICPSKNTQQTAQKIGVNSNLLHVIGYGIDINKYKPVKSKKALREIHELDLDRQVILILSRISAAVKMDLAPVLRVLPQLVKKNPKVLLYIVGSVLDVNYVNELKQLVKYLEMDDYVVWDHHPNHEVIEQYYQCSDIFLSLSDYCGETFGLTVMEAMACGLPVVISDFAGYKDHILTNEVEGFLIPTVSGDVNLSLGFYCFDYQLYGRQYSQSVAMNNLYLIDVLDRLLDSSKLRQQVGKNALKKIKQYNTLDKMYQDYVCVLQQSIDNSKTFMQSQHTSTLMDISAVFSHQVSGCLKLDSLFSLTEQTADILQTKRSFFLFESQWKEYKLIRVLLHLLKDQSLTLLQLTQKVDAAQSEIEKNCLFLLKQYVIVLEDG